MKWPEKKIGDLTEVLSGFAFDSQFFNNEMGFKLIRIRDVVRGFSETFYNGKFEDRYVVKEGDFLIGMDGEFNIAKWGKEPALLNQRVCKITVKNNLLDEKYLFHFLPKQLKLIEDVTPFVTVKHLSVKKINEIKIPLPPLAEQQRIAAVLDTAERILKQRESAIAKLDQLASTTFDEMYDELDSVSTKSLGEILDLQRGASPRPISDWMTEDVDGVNWIKIADATASDKYIYKCKERIKKEAVAMTRYVKSGDFLLSNSMSFGRPYILKTDGCIHDGWLLLRDTKNIFEQDYLYAVLSCRSVKEQFKKLATGAVVKNLNIDAVSKVKVKIPSQDIQKIFSKKMHELESNKANHVKQLGVINKLLGSLQHQSFAVN